jgi:glycine betaine/proline transport system substrate-binding protein
MGLLPAGCGFGEPKQITLGYLTWDENIAVSNLTKVLLEGDLGYENVELRRAGDVAPAYKMVRRAEADAFMDRMELTGAQVTSLQTDIREAGNPIKGARIWL